MKFEIHKNEESEQPFRVVLVADNGEPLMVSENLTSRAAAHTNIEAVQRGAAEASVEDLSE